jgi:hypothetical protein
MNKYREYFLKEETEWHSREIGVYHVSQIGNSHKELDPQKHYGPCLLSTYEDYKNPEERDLLSTGNLAMGTLLHKVVQKRYKKNHPNSVIEFPIVLDYQGIRIMGSVDIIDFDRKAVMDIKTASLFTFPGSEYDYNPTYISQVKIYTALLELFVFGNKFFVPEELVVIYVKKHNLEVLETPIDYNGEDIMDSYDDFYNRCIYLDECLQTGVEPEAEPHKWCKFCSRLSRCKAEGRIKQGLKKNWYVLK